MASCFSPEEQTLTPQTSIEAKEEAPDPPPTYWSMPSLLLVVTGASKGLGKAIAQQFCFGSILQVQKLHVILAARSSERLEELGRTILQHHEPTRVHLTCHKADLSDLEQLDGHFDRMFNEVDLSTFDRVVFVNNAGSLGHLGPCAESPSLADMRNTVDLNVTSSLWMSSRFAKLVRESGAHKRDQKPKAVLVNVSSLLAVQSFPTMGIYGAGKAARDHFHATMAKETPAEQLKVLNYAPGPLETDMVTEIRTAPQLDEGLRPAFDKKLIEPEESAAKLVKLILSDQFESGQHVDFYDLDDDGKKKEDEKEPSK